MSDPLAPSMGQSANKLNDLNKKIVEIKKKIQLSGKPALLGEKTKLWKSWKIIICSLNLV